MVKQQTNSSKNQSPSEPSKARSTLALLLIVIFITLAIAFRHLGRWLIKEDPLQPAGAVVVLSGGVPFRAAEAGHIYSAGLAPQVWLTTTTPPPGLESMGIAYKGEEMYSREVLLHEGVPASAITLLTPEVRNTQDEEHVIVDAMRQAKITKIIAVTAPEHTRRVHKLWGLLAPKDLQLLARGAPLDPYDADHWWRTTRDGLSVVRECLGLFNAWTGLRIQSGQPEPKCTPRELQR